MIREGPSGTLGGDRLRLAELLAPLSMVTDLGMGNAPEDAMRSCLLATAVARRLNLPDQQVADVYWTGLLRHVGCTASAHEEAAHARGDEVATRTQAGRTDFHRARDMVGLTAATVKNAERGSKLAALVMGFGPWGNRALHATCEAATLMAERLGLGSGVQAGLYESFERWDGKGVPDGRKGDAISIASRVTQVAVQAIAFAQAKGPEAVPAMVRRRSGSWFDPAVCDMLLRHTDELFGEIAEADSLTSVLEVEPAPHLEFDEPRLVEIAQAFGDMTDLKSPYLHGHSSGVAALAEQASHHARLGEEAGRSLRLAGCFHDLGRVGVPTRTWDRPAALGTAEWERVRLHPYYSERILSRTAALAPLSRLVGTHHERLDGSGYHRQSRGGEITIQARILAAADAFQAMTQERPQRPRLAPNVAARTLREEAKGGRLDSDCVEAVLAAAEERPRGPRVTPAGLSEREVDVLRLVAVGLSNREIARRLFISPRTAEHHVQHVYAKIGLATRAGAALFAMRHGLVENIPAPEPGGGKAGEK